MNVNFVGSWSSLSPYNQGDFVTYNNVMYIALNNIIANQQPPNINSDWEIVVFGGDTPPTPTPTPTVTTTPGISPTGTPSLTVTPTPTNTPTETIQITPSGTTTPVATVTPTETPQITPSGTTTPVATVTPTPTNTPTETIQITPSGTTTPVATVTPTETPINTPTPSVTPEPVTGYSFNLVSLPYNFPSSGNTIMNNPPTNVSGSTNPNLLGTSPRGLYWNITDSDGIDRSSYFSQFTGQSVTITMSQTGSTAIYSGDTNSLKYWTGNTGTPPGTPGSGFVFGTGIGLPPSNIPSGAAVLIQSATTEWTVGLPVYISVVINGSVTPTPTPTQTQTSTPTNTSTPTPTNTPTETIQITPTVTPTPSNAPAGFVATVTEVGGNVVWSGSGSFNLTDLTYQQTYPGTGTGFNGPDSTFGCGINTSVDTYSGATFNPPFSFGIANSPGPANSTSGSYFGVFTLSPPPNTTRSLMVPAGYTSGTIISAFMTYNSTTLATLGLTPGTYVYSWGTGPNYSTLTLIIG
jgi:hypothetical protein